MAIEVETLSGETAVLTDDELGELRLTFRGRLLGPHDSGYEEARVAQNGAIDRRPALIIQCSGAADVMDAVALVRSNGFLTAVRGGGHSIAGHSVCDNGILIDLSPMRGVWVDPRSRVVRVQGGATWGDVDRETQAFGLAVPGGVVSTTGVAGLTLGGGIGWLHRTFGLACDNLRAAEVVTAEGGLLRASDSENEDLFWGLRGGGGNFGVVTAFEFAAHSLGPIVMCAAPIYAADGAGGAGALLRAWRDWTATVPDEVTTRAIFWTAPEDPHLPPQVHNREVLVLGAVYAGPPGAGAKVVQPIREFAAPLADLSGELPFRAFQAAFDFFFTKGSLAGYWKSVYLNRLTEAATDLVVRQGLARATPESMVHVPLLGGAVSRVAPDATAFGDRSAPYMLSVDGNWRDPASSHALITWVRRVVDEAAGHATGGTYLNFDGYDEQDSSDLVAAAYGENLRRLREIKRKYDPQNLFRINNNIPPAAG